MANNEIKQKIVLEGEQQYKQALKDAQRNLKTLRSELKAETAELGNNATAQQKNETRAKNLQKQIKEQENVVKTLKAALEEVKEKYGDNEDAVAKWEQKLNDARTSLANMKNDLDGIGNSFKTMEYDANTATIATKSCADALDSLSSAGESISSTVENIFTNMVNTVKSAIADVWADIVDLAARANNYEDLAGFWNTSGETIQKYKHAVGEISGSLEDLSSLVTKINTGDAKKIFAFSGVNKENYKDEWQYAMDVMSALSRMNHEARNSSATEIFGGKQATKAYDLLNDWLKLEEELDKYDPNKKGYGLTEGELQEMSDLYDKVNGLRESWEALQDMATVKLFGSLSMDLTGNAQAILDALLKYFNAESDEERDAALAEMEQNITSAFERIGKAIEDGLAILEEVAQKLQGSENPTVRAIGTVLQGLVDALQWITEDNMSKVVSALEILAGFWLAGKGLQMANKIASVVANLATIKAFQGGGFAAAGASAGTSATGGAGIAAAGGGILPVVGGLAGLAAFGFTFNWARDRRQNHAEEVRGTDEYLQAKTGGELAPALTDYLNAEQELVDLEYQILNGEKEEEDYEAQQAKVLEAYNALMGLEGGPEALQAFKDWRNEHSYDADYWEIPEALLEELTQVAEEYIKNDNPDWWTNTEGGNTGGLTSDDISGFKSIPGGIKLAVREGISNIKVVMSAEEVGRLVAPYVSQKIAEGMP